MPEFNGHFTLKFPAINIFNRLFAIYTELPFVR